MPPIAETVQRWISDIASRLAGTTSRDDRDHAGRSVDDKHTDLVREAQPDPAWVELSKSIFP